MEVSHLRSTDVVDAFSKFNGIIFFYLGALAPQWDVQSSPLILQSLSCSPNGRLFGCLNLLDFPNKIHTANPYQSRVEHVQLKSYVICQECKVQHIPLMSLLCVKCYLCHSFLVTYHETLFKRTTTLRNSLVQLVKVEELLYLNLLSSKYTLFT